MSGQSLAACWGKCPHRAAWKFARMANGWRNLSTFIATCDAKVRRDFWWDERNLTRRVVRVKERSEDRVLLEVQRFGNAKPGRLEFGRTGSPRSAGRIAREQFCARFRRILTESFPDATIESLSASPARSILFPDCMFAD